MAAQGCHNALPSYPLSLLPWGRLLALALWAPVAPGLWLGLLRGSEDASNLKAPEDAKPSSLAELPSWLLPLPKSCRSLRPLMTQCCLQRRFRAVCIRVLVLTFSFGLAFALSFGILAFVFAFAFASFGSCMIQIAAHRSGGKTTKTATCRGQPAFSCLESMRLLIGDLRSLSASARSASARRIAESHSK